MEKGDTLYFIAYVTDKDVNDIIRYNDLKALHHLSWSKLKLWQPVYKAPATVGRAVGGSVPVTLASTSAINTKSSKDSNQAVSSNKAKIDPISPTKATVNKVDQSSAKEYVGAKSKTNVNKPVSYANPNSEKISKWLWPAKGG